MRLRVCPRPAGTNVLGAVPLPLAHKRLLCWPLCACSPTIDWQIHPWETGSLQPEDTSATVHKPRTFGPILLVIPQVQVLAQTSCPRPTAACLPANGRPSCWGPDSLREADGHGRPLPAVSSSRRFWNAIASREGKNAQFSQNTNVL